MLFYVIIMEKEWKDILKHISETLDEILLILKKPENKFIKVLDISGAVVSVLAILGIVEIIKKWIQGG